MANEYYQTSGSYPYLPDIPDVLESTLPIPYSFYTEIKGEYPTIQGIPNLGKITYPIPYSFYGQDDITNNGYPFLDLPKFIEGLRMPLPHIMYEPNKAREIEYKIVIQKCDSNITIPDFRIRVTVPKYDVLVQNEVII